jgi:flagellar biogenesis protein FliO
VVISTFTFAQSTQPASRFDDQPVRSSRTESAGPTTRSALNQLPSVKFDWPRVALALGGVIAIIFTLRWGARKYLGVAAATGAGKIVRVLGRATIGPRQQIVMLQIGKRVIIAADNAGQLSTLSQVTEADEVASLLGQFEETNNAAPPGLFSKWFKHAEADFEAPDPEDQLALAGAPKMSASQPTQDSSLQSARGEIASLMDKAREMARQIRRNG